MTTEASITPRTYGLILAGGLARRMGGCDKALIRIGGQTILARVLERISADCVGIIINANGDPDRFAQFNLPVVPDSVAGFVGPLAGILAGLDWIAREVPEIEWIVSVPGDCPFVPRVLVPRLHAAREAAGTPLAVARSGGQAHPVVGLWRVTLRNDLRHAIVDEGLRKIDSWTARHGVVAVEWPDHPNDPFFNVNTPEDLAAAEGVIAQDFEKLSPSWLYMG